MIKGKFLRATDSPKTFKFNEESLADWLHGLPADNHLLSCKKIFALLETFNPADLNPRQAINILDKVGQKAELSIEQLEKSYLDAGIPLSAEELEKSELATQVLSIIAKRYLEWVQNEGKSGQTLSNKEKATALYFSLQALGKSLLQTSMVYRQPFDGFWLQSYQVYKMAEASDLLGINVPTQQFAEGTVSSAFKHMLLFELTNSFQFRPRDMKKIFQLLQHHSATSTIETDCRQESVQQLCSFNLNTDKPPKLLIRETSAKDAEDRFISPTDAARNLHRFLQQPTSGNALKSINDSVFTRAIKSLSLTQRRKFGRSKEQINKNCIVGFREVAGYIYQLKQDEGFETLKNDLYHCDEGRTTNFDLVAMDDDASYQLDSLLKKNQIENANIVKALIKNREYADVYKVWKPNDVDKIKRSNQIPFGEIEIIDSSAKGLQAFWKSRHIKIKVGEIIALPNNHGDKVQIGLIRRIHVSSLNEVRLGIEMIGSDSSLIGLIKPEQPKQTYIALFLPGIPALHQGDSILYQTSDLAVGEFVNLIKNGARKTCRLQRVINSTAAITQMELHYTREGL